MIKAEFKSFDNKEISYLFFESKRGVSKGSVLIIHGMMETKERYIEFSEFLSSNGYNTFILDLRGHDDFCIDNKPIYFSKDEGTSSIINDMNIFIKEIIKETPVILGHSFGSVLSLRYAEEYNETDRIILSGSPYISSFDLFFGKITAAAEGVFVKKRKSILNGNFLSYNKHFKPNKSKNDWLTRDEKEIKKYEDNLKCGTYATPRFFKEFFNLYEETKKNLSKINKKAKLLIIYGSEDMAAGQGKYVNYLRNKLKSMDRSVKILENKDGRHESLNEINKYEIYDFILEWLNKNI